MELVVGQFALEDGLAGLAGHEPALEGLDEGHGFFHLGFGDAGAEVALVEGEGGAVEGLAHHFDVLALPGRVGFGGEDGELFGQFGVEGYGFAFFFFLELRGFGGGDARGGTADVFASAGEMRVRRRD